MHNQPQVRKRAAKQVAAARRRSAELGNYRARRAFVGVLRSILELRRQGKEEEEEERRVHPST